MAELFRKKSLEKLSSPERLNTALQVESNRSWVILSGFALIVASVIIWSFTFEIPTEVVGSGVLLRGRRGFENFISTGTGFIKTMLIKSGDVISPGDTVMILNGLDGKDIDVKSINLSGKILETLVDDHGFVKAGEHIATIESVHEPLLAKIFIRADQATNIEVGMKTKLSLDMIPVDKHGYIVGKVTRKSLFPVSNRKMQDIFEGSSVMSLFSNLGPVIAVDIELEKADTLSGYLWTSGQSPNIRLRTGMMCVGKIIANTEKPIDMFLPVKQK